MGCAPEALFGRHDPRGQPAQRGNKTKNQNQEAKNQNQNQNQEPTMLPLDLGNQDGGLWPELGLSAPMLWGFAQLCAAALQQDQDARPLSLSVEARAILFAARNTGALELKAARDAFTAQQRWLTVRAETSDDRWLAFRDVDDPEFTVRCLEAFRSLCREGCLLHHAHHDFSLSHRGWAAAKLIRQEEVQRCLDQAADIGPLE